MRIILVLLLVNLSLIFSSCLNPFAPGISDIDYSFSLGDQTTIDGFFQSFAYAYSMKDTLHYGNLLADDFIFSYRNYEKEMDFTWTRSEDMLATYGLFNAAQNLDFVWNEVLVQSGDDTQMIINRSFDLTIMFNHNEPVVRASGRVHFVLNKNQDNDKWMLSFWRDDSFY